MRRSTTEPRSARTEAPGAVTRVSAHARTPGGPKSVASFVAVTLVTALLLVPAASDVADARQLEPRPEQGRKAVATGQAAMVSTSHPEVTRVALEVLRDGGNAVDALLTAVPFQTVLEPQMSTLAGGMGGLIYWAETGELVYLDAELDHTSDRPPAGHSYGLGGLDVTSGLRVGVPGTVRGLAAAADRYGTRPWAEYFEPAARLADEGFTMYSFLYGEMADAFERLGAHAATRDKWFPDGFIPRVGDVVVQPRLAGTLRRLGAEGPEYFYAGEWAQRFVDEVNRTGGRISMQDLADYEVRWAEPVRFSYLGHDMAGAPPASTAGVLNGMILNILEHFDLAGMDHYTESARTLALLRQAYDLAQMHMVRFIGDPRVVGNPVDLLLSKDYAAQLAALIPASWPTVDLSGNDGTVDPPSHRQESGQAARRSGHPARRVPEGLPHIDYQDTDTNHLVIVDEQGNWVSMTHTVYGSTFATGLTVDGVGVNSGNTFPGVGVGDGRRVITPFPALMSLDADGQPWLAIGSPGLSSRAVALVLINLVGFGLEPYDAVDAPRFQGYGPGDPFTVESRVPEDVLDGLAAYGIRVEPTAPYNWHMGSIQLVVRDPADGGLSGIADPRRGGHAEGY